MWIAGQGHRGAVVGGEGSGKDHGPAASGAW